MKILIINYFYPPVVDAHAYRWEQIARHWITQGHQVDIICGRLYGVPDRGIQAGVNVTRVGLAARPTMHSPSTKARKERVRERLSSLLVDALRPFYRKLYWPDAWWHWWPSALREVLKRRHVNYDLVVSYYPSFSAHFTAAALKRWTKSPGLKWIADYGDPFATSLTMPPNNFALYGRLNQLAERYVGRQADMLVFTNESTAAAFHDARGCPQDKLRVIPHLVDLRRLYAGGQCGQRSTYSDPSCSDTTHLLYIGSFHRGIREPDLLFDIVRRLNRNTHRQYILTIYGPTNGFDLTPADCPQIRYKGMIEREKALDLLREADVLVNVDNMNCAMVPSKIVEYIGTGRPLLNLTSGGASHAAVGRYAACQLVLELSREILASKDVDHVAHFLARTAGTIASLDLVEQVLKDHTLFSVAEQYQTLVRLPRPQAIAR